MDFDEPRIGDERPRRGQRRVESLRLPHGQHDAGSGGGIDQLVGLVQRSRHRFFDQDRHPRAQERQRDLAVQIGRHGDGHGIDRADQLVKVESGSRAVCRGDLGRTLAVRVDDGHELDAGQRRQNPRVMLTEMPDADDRNAQGHSPDHEGTVVLRALRVFVVPVELFISAILIVRRCRCPRRRRP
jgi:hypothetical protein